MDCKHNAVVLKLLFEQFDYLKYILKIQNMNTTVLFYDLQQIPTMNDINHCY